jgi:hypothetical protein
MADQRIQDLRAATTPLTGNELLYMDNGTNDVKVTSLQLGSYVGAPTKQTRAGMATRSTFVFDDFDVADGTLLSGRTAPTGQTWIITGANSAGTFIKGGGFQLSTLTNSSVYAYLPYGATVPRIAGTFTIVPATSSTTPLPDDVGFVVIADNLTGGSVAQNCLHFHAFGTTTPGSTGQYQWAFSKRINNVQTTLASGTWEPSPYGGVYSMSIDLTDIANNNATITGPDGTQQIVNDGAIGTTIVPTYGVWQVVGGAGGSVISKCLAIEIGYSDARMLAGAGGAVSAIDLAMQRGDGFKKRQRINRGSVTLSGGSGWYRIAKADVFATHIVAGRIRLDAQDGTYYNLWDFNFSAVYGSSVAISQNVGNAVVGTAIDQARISYDTGTSGDICALDVHLPHASTVTLSYVLEGFGLLVAAPVVGATALVGASATLTFADAASQWEVNVGSALVLDYGVTTTSKFTAAKPVNVTDSTATSSTTTGALVVTGGIAAGNAVAATAAAGFYLGSQVIINSNVGYTRFQSLDGSGGAINLGTNGDPTNYYDQTIHEWRGNGGGAAKMYLAMGLFVGSSPSDPGAGNVQVKNSLGVGTAPLSSAFAAIAAGTTSEAQINFGASSAPTSPNNGDFWFDGTNFKCRVGGATKTFTIS